jgi:hypothetical protein
MEKGLKTILSTARTAHKRNSASQSDLVDDHEGISDRYSDSGIGLGSDAEMDIDDPEPSMPLSRKHASSWTGPYAEPKQRIQHQSEHIRSRSLPQPLPAQSLPLYRPPPPIVTAQSRRAEDFEGPMTTSPATMSFVRHTATQRYSPENNGRGGISIESVLSPAPQCV